MVAYVFRNISGDRLVVAGTQTISLTDGNGLSSSFVFPNNEVVEGDGLYMVPTQHCYDSLTALPRYWTEEQGEIE